MDETMDIGLATRPLLFVALAALAFVPLEHVAAAHPRRRRGLATDLAFATVGQVLVRVGLVAGVGWTLFHLDSMALERPLLFWVGDRRLRFALNTAAGLVLFELASYGYHRLAHRVPWMWRLHEVHHSSETMDWLASFRQHPLEILLMTLAQNAPLVLLGVPLGAHATVLVLLKLGTVFVHSNLRLSFGPLRLVLATPGFHHRHHQRTGTPRNFAAFFPFIDRLFGTHSAEVTTDFGLPSPLPDSFVGLLLHPLRPRRAPDAEA